jgi:hypothetical protein
MFPLVQVTALPCFMMARQNASPYRARDAGLSAISISSHSKTERRTDQNRPALAKCVFPERLTKL